MKRQRHALQASHLSVEGIGDCWVRLDSGRASAALEVDGIPFGLLSDAEQDSAVTAYAAFLQGLEQPLQIIVRLLPADLQRQLEELDAQAQRLPAALAQLRPALAGSALAGGIAIALLRPHGRGLLTWTLVVGRYLLMPRRYVWRPCHAAIVDAGTDRHWLYGAPRLAWSRTGAPPTQKGQMP